MLVRFGGDEFTLLMERSPTARQATRLAERVHAALGAPFVVDGNEVVLSASIGIVLGSASHLKPVDLLRDADTAMYRAKALGRGRHQLFDEAMHREAMEVLNLEMEMRRGLARGEFRLYYQPIVCIRSGQVRAVEALLRWEHPRRGLLLPETFVPLAEENGLIVPLGSWVLRESCRQLGAWDVGGRRAAARPHREPLAATALQAGLPRRRVAHDRGSGPARTAASPWRSPKA